MRANATTHPETTGNAALDKYVRRYCGFLRFPDLDQDEDDQKRKSEHKQGDYASIIPLNEISSACPVLRNLVQKTYAIGETTPLQRQAQTDDTWNKGKRALDVELLHLVFPRARGFRIARDVQQEENEYEDCAS
jgi:hypothetical protein